MPNKNSATPKKHSPAPIEPPATPEQLHEMVRCAAKSIVESIIEQAKTGSYLHAKFLFELAGLQAVLPEPLDAEEESLAEILLRELNSGEPASPAAQG